MNPKRTGSGRGSSHFAVVGQVSGLPVRGGSASVKGRRPLELADLEVYPTSVTQNETCWSCRGRSARSLLCSLFLFLLTAGPLAALPLLLGDLDGDNQPTILDLVRLIGHINGVSPLGAALQPYGDINEDGLINQADLDLLPNAILGLAPLHNPFAPPFIDSRVSATNGSTVTITGIARPARTAAGWATPCTCGTCAVTIPT